MGTSPTPPRPLTRPAPVCVTSPRVSTGQQGRSGLGLEAQRAAVAAHVDGARGRIVAEHVEVERGRKKDRLQLVAALEACRAMRAVLVIAKLDRLARNVVFISNLMESGVEFGAADMPSVKAEEQRARSTVPGGEPEF